ncbi:translocation/assembly module TamB domain-containing protein [Sulfitobacter albidus]|uniref:Translocation/assembly module TamB domain-containing protein n=1 Tax=Sulfitobacter albidus TaxID=2829501 RepID=A0A975JEY7_9RHOB|nr:translocation/assembly module TamB domain-containing protein [Sulfitobacter albidus]QUJ77213.1 translocation/assembly module TamB domain-containing protein [Sulfitobacter albidus]
MLLAFAVQPAAAQEEGEGFLTRQIQNVLSGAGRDVDIVGFRGALSSSASFDRMTIADDEGIWLTLEDVVLDWNRSALLRGRLEVEELSAALIDLARLPNGDPDALPSAEAQPFTFPTLPDLPVSIDIEQLNANEISLGESILGQAVSLSLEARAQLNDTGLDAKFTASRIDGARGVFDITAVLGRDNVLDLAITAQEAEDGIAATLMNIPGTPSVDLTLTAAGPLSDLPITLQLDTDGEERLAGEINLAEEGDAADPDRRITADIGGDLTAIILPEYRDFFGRDVSLRADALIGADGSIAVSDLALLAAAVDLTGDLALAPDGWPQRIDLEGTVARADGEPVLLPGGNGDVTVGRIALDVDYDVANGEAYQAVFDIANLVTAQAQADQVTLRSTGTLSGANGGIGQLRGAVNFATQALALADPALAEAIGPEISGRADINYLTDQPMRISGLDLEGSDYGLTGDLSIDNLTSGVDITLDAGLTASDLSRFSALAGRELAGAAALQLAGEIGALSGTFDLTAQGTTEDIITGIAQADALLEGRTDLNLRAIRNVNGTFLRDLELNNPALLFIGSAELATDNSRVDADLTLRDISTVLPQYEGPVTLTGSATQDAIGWRVDVDADGPYDAQIRVDGLATGPDADIDFSARVPRISDFAEGIEGALSANGSLRQTPEGYLLQTDASGPYDANATINGLITPAVNVAFDLSLPELSAVTPQVSGPLRATGRLRQTADGFEIDTDASGPYDADLSVTGTLTPALDIGFDVSLPQVAAVAPQVNGPLNATGRLRQTDDGFEIDTEASGPYNSDLSVQGALTPAVDIAFDLAVPNLAPLVPQARGPLNATGRVRQTERGFFVDTDARGPAGSRALVEGLATGPDMSLTFDVNAPNVAAFAPGINGALAATGSVQQTEAGLRVNTNATGPYSSRARVEGVVTGPQAAVDFSFAMPDIGRLVDQINGPLSVDGSANKVSTGWRLDTDVAGPAGTRASVAGTVADSGTLNLDVAGQAPLGLTQPFLEPRVLQGIAQFDLAVNGPPALSSVTGTIRTGNASFTAPNLRLGLEGISADIRLANSRAALDVRAAATGGGGLTATGGIGLGGGLPADLAIALQGVVVQDPRLYRTTIDGNVNINGPLAGGARIAGDLNVGETVVTVPSTGLTSIGDIPPITHIGAPADNRATRDRAGLLEEGAASDPTASGGGSGGYPLAIDINAPGRIFVRGRGLDAELGGSLRLTGTTNNIISAGRFELQRGRLDILGKRFDLEEGSATFQGDFVPYIRFVTTTSTESGTVSVIVEGPADSPDVTFSSNPEAPQDEVLAQLLFGRNISEISAFQALQLANAVATLAGRGGNGVVGNLRDQFGLDDLDVTTTDDGETALRIGKYLTDNVYTDVTAASDGTADVSLNLDITPNLKGKATLGSDGNSSLGIFFERDY